MVMTRSPLRITLGGGGTDLPSYYREHGGFLVSGAIDKYVFVTVNRPFYPGIFLKYSKLEQVQRTEDIQHPIIREALKVLSLGDSHIEISTFADIPAGTGLGSSGSFTTALLRALSAYQTQPILPSDLARMACEIEIDRLKEPIGKQDQYIAAFGGITCFTFNPDDTVEAVPLRLDSETLFDLEDNLLLFLHRGVPKRGRSPEGPGPAHKAGGRGDDCQPPLREGVGNTQQEGAGGRKALRRGRHHA